MHAAGQSSQFIDHLFTGNVLGHESDIADGRLRGWEFRSFANLVGDYYVSPRFLEAVAVRSIAPQTLMPLKLPALWLCRTCLIRVALLASQRDRLKA